MRHKCSQSNNLQPQTTGAVSVGNITITNTSKRALKLRFESEVEPRKRYSSDYELEHQTFLQGKAAIEQQRMTVKQNLHGLLLSPNEVAVFEDDTEAYAAMVSYQSVLEDRYGLTVEINA